MVEQVLWLLVVAAFAVAWVEWIPQRYEIFPQILIALLLIPAGIGWMPYWYGWATSLLGIAVLVWLYFSSKRRQDWPNLFNIPAIAIRHFFAGLKAAVVWVAVRFRRWKIDKATVTEKAPLKDVAASPAGEAPPEWGARIRVWFGAEALFVLSPWTAIPWSLLTVLVLVTGDALLGSLPAFENGAADVAKFILGRTFVTVIASIDVVARYALLMFPIFLAAAYVVSRWAARTENYWRRFFIGLFNYGALYPVVFIVADIFDAHSGPLYN